eukprot:TRINITY_DN21381_c0_g3_i1.p1 TRINITY_DN21381_c0_g3~~TRINITY_DN21381_c0_g3_i1.p1  ORF type:complete len:255 (+),score=49.36 TRINITY_DN21381_c0_g3_i1:122-886(+)
MAVMALPMGGCMRTSGLRLFAKRGHSPQWIQRHISDRYVQLAAEKGYRSRSAFKLRQLDEKYKFLRKRQVVVDLGCFAGGWSQVAVERTGADFGDDVSMVIGVDTVQMVPLEHQHFVRGDIREVSTLHRVKHLMKDRQANVVLSDLAPKMTGIKIDDTVSQIDLSREALRFAEAILKERGTFVVKVFDGHTLGAFKEQLEQRFGAVRNVKPEAVRKQSKELYLVCLEYLQENRTTKKKLASAIPALPAQQPPQH